MLKSTGIVRMVDQLGRIVVPKEVRRKLEIAIGQDMEIYVEGERILLKKYIPSCMFCGSVEGVSHYKEKQICGQCVDEMILAGKR